MKSSEIGIIILAAGGSTRLGRPKQLLEFKGQTLIEKVCETALETGFQTVVVLGAFAAKIKPLIEDLSVETVLNKDWQTGMSSSLQTGLQKLLEKNPDLSAAIFLLCDQPFVTTKTILKLVEKQKTSGKAIVASAYADQLGVPALFTKDLFAELLGLQGDVGARFLIKKYGNDYVAKISAPEAEFDIDTERDIEQLPEG